MIERLSDTNATIMAGHTVVHDAYVAKRHICKTAGIMTIGAILAVGSGRYVVRKFTDTDHIIVAGVTTTQKRRAGMTKGARAKCTRGMASTAILNGWHVFV